MTHRWHRRKFVLPQVTGGRLVEMDPEKRADAALDLPEFFCIRHGLTPKQRLDAACIDMATNRKFEAEIWRTGARVYVRDGRSQARNQAVSQRLFRAIAAVS